MTTTITEAPLTNHTTSYFSTNHNNKLACDCMIHIELAPAGGIGESVLEETIFEFRTQDHNIR